MAVFALREPEPHVAMLDRFLVIAEANGLASRVVVNKVDLADEAEGRKLFGTYETIGYPLHITSCRTGAGLEALREELRGRTSVVTGPSGVGKSSLLNALYPGLGLRVGRPSAVSAWKSTRPANRSAVRHAMPPVSEVGRVSTSCLL